MKPHRTLLFLLALALPLAAAPPASSVEVGPPPLPDWIQLRSPTACQDETDPSRGEEYSEYCWLRMDGGDFCIDYHSTRYESGDSVTYCTLEVSPGGKSVCSTGDMPTFTYTDCYFVVQKGGICIGYHYETEKPSGDVSRDECDTFIPPTELPTLLNCVESLAYVIVNPNGGGELQCAL